MKYIRTDKIFYHPERVQDWLSKKMVLPITMEIHLTNKCNLKCNYCFFMKKHNKGTLSTDDVEKIIREFAKVRVKGITLSGGGEPTVHKDFEDIVRYIYNQRIEVGLITNGVIYPDILDCLTWVRFSLDTFDKTTYKKIKGVDKFDQTENTIKRVITCKKENNLKVTIGIQMVVTEDNYKDIIPMSQYAEDLKADYFQFRPLENANYPNYVWGEINRSLRYFDVCKNKIQVITSQNKWDEITGDSKKVYKGCPGADFIGVVDAKGDYYICCHHVQDETAKYGNLIKENIFTILRRRKQVHNSFDYSKCPVACRGSSINLALSKFNKLEHINFL